MLRFQGQKEKFITDSEDKLKDVRLGATAAETGNQDMLGMKASHVLASHLPCLHREISAMTWTSCRHEHVKPNQ